MKAETPTTYVSFPTSMPERYGWGALFVPFFLSRWYFMSPCDRYLSRRATHLNVACAVISVKRTPASCLLPPPPNMRAATTASLALPLFTFSRPGMVTASRAQSTRGVGGGSTFNPTGTLGANYNTSKPTPSNATEKIPLHTKKPQEQLQKLGKYRTVDKERIEERERQQARELAAWQDSRKGIGGRPVPNPENCIQGHGMRRKVKLIHNNELRDPVQMCKDFEASELPWRP